MLKLARNIASILIIGICSLLFVSQFSSFLLKSNSNITEITEHFNKEHSHKFDLSKIQFQAQKVYNPIEKINFTESSFNSFAALCFAFLIILNFKKIFFQILRFTNNQFVTSFLIPPKFS